MKQMPKVIRAKVKDDYERGYDQGFKDGQGAALLEALKALIEPLGPGGYHPAAGKPACDQARAAIALATISSPEEIK